MRKNLLFSFLSILIGCGQLMAQDRTLTGVVKDENGQSLPGVNVLLKGSNRGTSADGSGSFKLNVPNTGTLIFSSVGRTGFPKLYARINSENTEVPANGVVRRTPFVLGETNTNPKGVESGVSKLGGPDRSDTRLWWDKP